MAIPATAKVFTDKLDPKEVIDWRFDVAGLLEDGELVSDGTWTLSPSAEAVLYGLTIMSGGGRDPELNAALTAIIFWTEIDNEFKADPAFESGLEFGIEVLFNTDALPSRTRHRTGVLGVRQQ